MSPLFSCIFSIRNRSVYIRQNGVSSKFSGDESWTILSPIEQSIKAKIEALGTPLKDWDIRINYGIKTGCNEAFIIDKAKRDEILSNCKSDEEYQNTAKLIRPILRGRDIKRYGYSFNDLYLIASHNGYTEDNGNEILPINVEDYPAIKAHLDKYWEIISVRTDKGITPYNLRNCAYMDDFSKQKIIYREISDKMDAVIETNGYFVNNKCYLITGEYINYLCSYFNSKLFNIILAETNTTGGKGPDFIKNIKAIKPSGHDRFMSDDEIIALYSLNEEEIKFISSSLNEYNE